MNAPTLSLRFSGISAAGEFVAAAGATVGTARAEIARDITVAATPAGIVMTTPEGFRLGPEIAAAPSPPWPNAAVSSGSRLRDRSRLEALPPGPLSSGEGRLAKITTTRGRSAHHHTQGDHHD